MGYSKRKNSDWYGKSESLEGADYDIEDIIDSMSERERRWFSRD